MDIDVLFSDSSDRTLGHIVYRRSEGWFMSSLSVYQQNGSDIPSVNVSNQSACNPLLDNINLHDGRIPQILGLTVGVWVVGHRAYIKLN